MNEEIKNNALDLCNYINEGPMPSHVVQESIKRLKKANFLELKESDKWELEPYSSYYISRNEGSIIAFKTDSLLTENSGFYIIGAHTDSPNLRLKPRAMYSNKGISQLGVEVYGGALLYSWLDKDLGLAGNISFIGESNTLSNKAIRIDKPICKIPSLAIHLDREVNEKGLILNRQQHLPAMFAFGNNDETSSKTFLNILSEYSQIEPDSIVSFNLGLFDLTPATLGGFDGSFVFAPRLDNLACSFSALTSIINSVNKCNAIKIVALFDNEEIGSETMHGAAGSFLGDVLKRIGLSRMPSSNKHLSEYDNEFYFKAIAKSFFISADMAHALHPNYTEKHEQRHAPILGEGPVVKSNINQRYATTYSSNAKFKYLCKNIDVPCQDFIARTDLSCGSTIGPIVSTKLGIETVDVGSPMLSMHSIRETASASDALYLNKVFTYFFDTAGTF